MQISVNIPLAVIVILPNAIVCAVDNKGCVLQFTNMVIQAVAILYIRGNPHFHEPELLAVKVDVSANFA